MRAQAATVVDIEYNFALRAALEEEGATSDERQSDERQGVASSDHPDYREEWRWPPK